MTDGSKAMAEKRGKWRILGLCISCGKISPDSGHKKCNHCLEGDKKYNANRRKSRLENGLCRRCGIRPYMTGKTVCVECRENAIADKKRRRLERKGKCMCIECGVPVTDGRVHCEQCNQYKLDQSAERIKTRKLAGLCATCGSGPPHKKYINCLACHTKKRAEEKSRYLNRVEQGLCVKCGSLQAKNQSALCEICTLKTAATNSLGSRKKYKELGSLFLSQKGRCPYTGIKLVLGSGASVDHIISKFKGGENKIQNLQWVHLWINLMKAESDDDAFQKEFDEFLAQTVKHRFGIDLPPKN